MRTILLSRLLAVALVGSVQAQEITSESTATPEQKEILKIEHDKVKALYEGGSVAADWFDRMEDDGLAQTNADGSTLTNAQHVAQRRSGDHKSLFQDHYDYRVRIYNGNTAVVTYLAYGITVSKGKPSSYVHVATTDVFVKQDGAWRTVVHANTFIPMK